jgi:hypothetical protein
MLWSKLICVLSVRLNLITKNSKIRSRKRRKKRKKLRMIKRRKVKSKN